MDSMNNWVGFYLDKDTKLSKIFPTIKIILIPIKSNLVALMKS